ncbi:MAG: PfkB family carbohydrate kinase, partial [Bacillota bacterium]|nr:PfkB family carbohydrate kinase [Bacillota bacterium]
AFVTALSKGKNEAEAIKFANKASSIAVTRKGAQEAIPTIEEMENM